jgi:hypothetical protein
LDDLLPKPRGLKLKHIGKNYSNLPFCFIVATFEFLKLPISKTPKSKIKNGIDAGMAMYLQEQSQW